jgi:hypothetical protein
VQPRAQALQAFAIAPIHLALHQQGQVLFKGKLNVSYCSMSRVLFDLGSACFYAAFLTHHPINALIPA